VSTVLGIPGSRGLELAQEDVSPTPDRLRRVVTGVCRFVTSRMISLTGRQQLEYNQA
jgi:hypothetical protein